MTTFLLSDLGRWTVALVAFVLLYLLKSSTWVKAHVLTTSDRRRIALALIACGPVVFLIVEGTDYRQVLSVALTSFFGAMGINSMRKP